MEGFVYFDPHDINVSKFAFVQTMWKQIFWIQKYNLVIESWNINPINTIENTGVFLPILKIF